MEVIVILDSPDNETYVVAIVAIPKGKTADETFEQWKTGYMAEFQIENETTPEEAADTAEGFYYEEETVVVLSTEQPAQFIVHDRDDARIIIAEESIEGADAVTLILPAGETLQSIKSKLDQDQCHFLHHVNGEIIKIVLGMPDWKANIKDWHPSSPEMTSLHQSLQDYQQFTHELGED